MPLSHFFVFKRVGNWFADVNNIHLERAEQTCQQLRKNIKKLIPFEVNLSNHKLTIYPSTSLWRTVNP